VARAWIECSKSKRRDSRNQKSRPGARAAFEGEQGTDQHHEIIMHEHHVVEVTLSSAQFMSRQNTVRFKPIF
jgi:hypothetical protein